MGYFQGYILDVLRENMMYLILLSYWFFLNSTITLSLLMCAFSDMIGQLYSYFIAKCLISMTVCLALHKRARIRGRRHFLGFTHGAISIFQKECNDERLVICLTAKMERKMRFKGLQTLGKYYYLYILCSELH